jgi:hypothetical protein
MLDGKTGLMSALVNGRYELVPIPDPKLGPRKVPPGRRSYADDMVGRSRSAIDRGGVPAATKLVRTMESAAWKEPRVSAS